MTRRRNRVPQAIGHDLIVEHKVVYQAITRERRILQHQYLNTLQRSRLARRQFFSRVRYELGVELMTDVTVSFAGLSGSTLGSPQLGHVVILISLGHQQSWSE